MFRGATGWYDTIVCLIVGTIGFLQFPVIEIVLRFCVPASELAGSMFAYLIIRDFRCRSAWNPRHTFKKNAVSDQHAEYPRHDSRKAEREPFRDTRVRRCWSVRYQDLCGALRL